MASLSRAALAVDNDAPEGEDGGPEPFEVDSMPETETAVSSIGSTVDLANSLRVDNLPLERLT
jgi:hypothetical protein